MCEVFGAGPPGDPESWVRPNPRCRTPRPPPALEPAARGASRPANLRATRIAWPGASSRSPPLSSPFLFVATYVVLGYVRHLRETHVLPRYPLFGLPLFDLPPAFAICVALAVLAMGYATVAYLPRSWQIPVVLLLVAWFGYANSDPFKNQFENMNYNKDDLVPLRRRVVERLRRRTPKTDRGIGS